MGPFGIFRRRQHKVGLLVPDDENCSGRERLAGQHIQAEEPGHSRSRCRSCFAKISTTAAEARNLAPLSGMLALGRVIGTAWSG